MAEAARQPEIIPDFATKEGTKRYFLRLAQNGIKIPSTTTFIPIDLTLSKIGFGTYRTHEFDPDHRTSLRESILGGCNVIDTSINYGNGSAERMIGDVCRELFQEGKLRRDEIVIISKIGYIQGDLMREAVNRQSRHGLWPEVTKLNAETWHCFHPEFLRDQITESLRRLKLNCLDGLLIHNPEYFFKAAQSRDEYYRRLDKALRHLEQEVADRRIRFYGVSSNTFPEPESRSDHTSLERICELAGNISKTNHFHAIQLPLNLYESGGALIPNNQRMTTLAFAQKKGLNVFINRPFNSFTRDRMVRLTSFTCSDPIEAKGQYHQLLTEALELERQAPSHLKNHEGLRWAHTIRNHFSDLDDLLAWKAYLTNKINPSVRNGLGKVPKEKSAWKDEYEQVLARFLRSVTSNLECLAQEKSQAVQAQLVQILPELGTSPTLSHALLRTYQSLPGVTCVLVGMRAQLYVEDCLQASQLVPQDKALNLLDRFQKHKS